MLFKKGKLGKLTVSFIVQHSNIEHLKLKKNNIIFFFRSADLKKKEKKIPTHFEMILLIKINVFLIPIKSNADKGKHF